jgi:hypothetical protein
MINFNLTLRNPWSDCFENIWYKAFSVTQHKNIELQVYKSSVIAEITLDFTTRQDHAGLRIEIGLMGYNCIFNLHDTRHWSRGKGQWDTYE